MKKIAFILVGVCALIIAFFCGRASASTDSMIVKQANGLLCYERYFEAAEAALDSIKVQDTAKRSELNVARTELIKYIENPDNVMQWPEVCDQRDKLSDAIRAYRDAHMEFEGNPDHDILEYVSRAGVNPEDLCNWIYAY